MTYEEKKEWLRRYRKAARMERMKLDEVEQYRTAAEHVTQVLSGMPGGAGDGQALPRAVERIMDAVQEANAQVMECQQIRKETWTPWPRPWICRIMAFCICGTLAA